MDVGGWAGRGGSKKKKSEYIIWQIRERGPSIKMTHSATAEMYGSQRRIALTWYKGKRKKI